MTKKQFKEVFSQAIDKKYKYIAVYVKIKQSFYPEIIINYYDNFVDKYNYYLNAYDDELKLKACNEISIIDIKAVNELKELQ